MRVLAATVAVVLGAGVAAAWEIDSSPALFGLPSIAFQTSDDGAHKLMYTCDGFAITFPEGSPVETGDLPLTLLIDGQEFSITGFALGTSQLIVNFEIDGLRNLVARTSDDILVKAGGRKLSFSAEGSAAALAEADEICVDYADVLE